MSECESVNIKKLPVINEVKNGDFLLIENNEGTQILDFENFIITEYNTTFQYTLSSHTLSISDHNTNIKNLSANQIALTGLWHPVLIGSSYTTDLYTLSGISIGQMSTPDEKLTVIGNISGQGIAFVDTLCAVGSTPSFFNTNVGIGTRAPSYPLEVESTDTDMNIRFKSTGTDGNVRLRFTNDSREYSFKIDGATSDKFHLRDETANADRVTLTTEGRLGIGEASPRTTFHVSTVSACMTIDAYTDTTEPNIPAESSQAAIYVKGNKLIVKYNDGGTTRYKHLPLSGTSVDWVHTPNSEPDV